MHTDPQHRHAISAGPRPPRFVVVDGLRASGKSTVAPVLAELLGAEFIAPEGPGFDVLRRHTDTTTNVNARLHLWMSENYARSDRARQILESGRSVVTESYFHRTLATHAATGARHLPAVDWQTALVPHATYFLRVEPATRLARMAARGRADRTGYWSRLEEANLHLTQAVYDGFDLTPVDIGSARAGDIAQRIADLENAATRIPRQPTGSPLPDGARHDPTHREDSK
ncbi:hypothetical protein GCM10010425_59490 [Streptomyces spororaveus]|uniref:Thymidylate kinase n=1 Tax=Streptomyces spororaveus TaxID=284039 RepID=A0ABQ3T747_9ACTN|nr:AAA family ATPase [Streptomyces spororaveus]GHI76180.1 hypothetical protein Sspor_17410 [Streptomyces spororaveus]